MVGGQNKQISGVSSLRVIRFNTDSGQVFSPHLVLCGWPTPDWSVIGVFCLSDQSERIGGEGN